MTIIEVNSRVDADGMLNLSIPLGKSEASREVKVTVSPIEKGPPGISSEHWKQWVEEIVGSISDPTFERQPQGEFEQREDLSS
jgi:hypothetical protein